MRTRSLAAITALLAITAARPAHAQPVAPPPAAAQADADRLVAEAGRHFEAGRLADALAAFRRAHDLVRDPKLLFAMAKLEVELGDCASAVEHLRQFLAMNPGPRATEAARQESAACAPPSATEPIPPPAGSPSTAATPAPGATPDATLEARPLPEPGRPAAAPVARSPWYRDTAGNLLVAAGGVGLVAGGVLAGLSWHSASAPADDLDEDRRLADRADDFGLAAAISGGVGAALVVGGIVRYATRDTGAPVDVAAAPLGDGWTVTASGRF
jgi:tetratricopeptide (TPR) repeat protein